MASEPTQRLLTVEEFLRIDFGSDMKAELDNGVIRMMAGGSRDHARIQMNVSAYLYAHLRGSGCRPYGSDMAIRAAEASVRYPDVTVDCGSGEGRDLLLNDPRVVFEVLSPSTRHIDQKDKLDEYRRIAGLDTIVFIDPEDERVRILQRIAPEGWSDLTYAVPYDVPLPALGLVIPHTEIFARD